MSKAILEFSLPEEQNEFTLATKGHQYWSCLWDIATDLRRRRKYGELSDEQLDLIEDIEKFFYEITDGLLEEVE